MKQSDLISTSALTAFVATFLFFVALQLCNVHVYATTALSFVVYPVVSSLTIRYMQKDD